MTLSTRVFRELNPQEVEALRKHWKAFRAVRMELYDQVLCQCKQAQAAQFQIGFDSPTEAVPPIPPSQYTTIKTEICAVKDSSPRAEYAPTHVVFRVGFCGQCRTVYYHEEG